jgi:hypothetical protein
MNKDSSRREKKFVSKGKFTEINNILPRVLNDLGLDRHLHEQSLFSLWPSLLEDVYASRSKPLYIDNQGILVVAVENGSTAQDLSFLKAKLLEQLQHFASGLGLSIKGMRFDLKHFPRSDSSEISTKSASVEYFAKPVPPDNELAEIKLDEEEINEILYLKQKLRVALEKVAAKRNDNTYSSQMVERITYSVEKKLRVRKWYVLKNMPICKRCAEPLPQSPQHLNRMLCSYCAGP